MPVRILGGAGVVNNSERYPEAGEWLACSGHIRPIIGCYTLGLISDTGTIVVHQLSVSKLVPLVYRVCWCLHVVYSLYAVL